jgi:hypothetical protein
MSFDPMTIIAHFEKNPHHILMLLFMVYRYVVCARAPVENIRRMTQRGAAGAVREEARRRGRGGAGAGVRAVDSIALSMR